MYLENIQGCKAATCCHCNAIYILMFSGIKMMGEIQKTTGDSRIEWGNVALIAIMPGIFMEKFIKRLLWKTQH